MSNERQDRAARAEQMRREREKADKRQRNVITIGIVVVVIALIAAATVAIRAASEQNSRNDKLVVPKFANKDYGIAYDTKAASGKAADNPVTVVLYEDFQCPACQAVEQESGAYLKQAVADGDITIEYRPVSFLDSNVTDDYSTRSTNTALCVLDTSDVKTYSAFHDVLFVAQSPESGPGLTDERLADLATEAGSKADLKTCINSVRFGPWLEKATAAWQKAGHTGTPTILIDGKKVEGPKQANGQGSLPRLDDIQKAVAAAKKS